MVVALKQPVIDLVSRSKPLDCRQAIGLPANKQQGFVIRDDFIKKVPLLAELTADQQRIISEWMRLENYETDQILFADGDKSDALYLIQQGWVNLYANGDNSSVTNLGPGSLVGETDFFLGRHRTITARTSSNVAVWLLDNSTLTNIIADHPEIGLSLGLALGTGIAQFQNHLAKQLAGIPFVQALSDDERKIIARHLAPQRYLPRDTIYRSGSPPTGIFFIEKGTVWLLSDTDAYTELTSGDVFGEKAVISGKPHANTVQAATEVILWQLSPTDFVGFASAYPSIKTGLSQNLSSKLTEALAIASLIVDCEIDALDIVCGDQHGMVRKLRQVSRTLTWLKNNQALL